MIGLSAGERILMIRSAVLIQYTRVTDGQTELPWHTCYSIMLSCLKITSLICQTLTAYNNNDRQFTRYNFCYVLLCVNAACEDDHYSFTNIMRRCVAPNRCFCWCHLQDHVAFKIRCIRKFSFCCTCSINTTIKYTGWPKNGTKFLYALTLPNINRFLKLFHCQNQEKICNDTIAIKISPRLKCIATLPCEMSVS